MTVLVGSRCVVTERGVPGATVTIAESGGQVDTNATDGTITVSAAASVVVTNSFPSSTGGGGGILPGTGSDGLGSILLVAVALLGAGTALVVLRRRSNRLGAR